MTEYTKGEQEEAYKNIAQVKIFTLAQIMKIINTAQTRGAFQASEMTFVGSIYDSISKGVNQAMLKAREDLSEEQNVIEPVNQEASKQQVQESGTVEPLIYNPEVPVFQPKPKKEKKLKKEKKSKVERVQVEHVEPVRSHEPIEELLEDSSDESDSSE